jgi:hypothetical protein
MILTAWEENCSSERKQKLSKTDNEFVNILVLKHFQKCCMMEVNRCQKNGCTKQEGHRFDYRLGH